MPKLTNVIKLNLLLQTLASFARNFRLPLGYYRPFCGRQKINQERNVNYEPSSAPEAMFFVHCGFVLLLRNLHVNRLYISKVQSRDHNVIVQCPLSSSHLSALFALCVWEGRGGGMGGGPGGGGRA